MVEIEDMLIKCDHCHAEFPIPGGMSKVPRIIRYNKDGTKGIDYVCQSCFNNETRQGTVKP